MALDCSPNGAPIGPPCPGDLDLWADAIANLMPPGWVWESVREPGTMMHGRARAIAELFDMLHKQACRLTQEFHCDTAVETLDSWNADYGIPDNCGITQLCPKVTTIGDGTCEALVEIGASLGYELCCEEFPIEMQCGCWNLGDEQMAPAVQWLEGGIDLGMMGLACVDPAAGSGLGYDPLEGDCHIAGYEELTPVPVYAPPPPGPCEPEYVCKKWEPPQTGFFMIGCPEPWRHDYQGNAHHIRVGIKGTSAILLDPQYPQIGTMEMGCDALCPPPVAEVICFVMRHRHAHVVPVPYYC